MDGKLPFEKSAGAAITHKFYRQRPPKRPVLIRQGQLNPPFETGKRFFEIFFD
jgi:hypothetical protein